MELRALLVDDEPLARIRMRDLLSSDQEISIVGEGRNGREANQLINSLGPDLLLLDIQMPDYNGFTVLSQIKENKCPVTIFVTAYDQFAIQAFENNALDYLLKPYDDNRFYKSILNAKRQFKLKQFAKLNEDLKDLVASYEWEQKPNPVTIPIKQNGMMKQVPINEIYWAEAQGNYVKLQLKDSWYLYRSTLSYLTNKLQQFKFLRIHRGLLINTQFITKVTYLQNNEYRFVFDQDQVQTSSRSYKTAICAYLEHNHNHP